MSIVEVKSREKNDTIKTEDVNQIGGHRTHHQNKYPDRPVYPLIFTDKGEVAKNAVEKAKGNVRILRGDSILQIWALGLRPVLGQVRSDPFLLAKPED